MEMDQLYTELILEHNQDKRNKHELAHFTNSEHGHNPSCGDDLTLQLNVEDGIIKDAAYTGSGCAISLVEIFLGMIKKEITDENELEELEDAMALQNISNMPARVKCAVLAWHTLKEALKK